MARLFYGAGESIGENDIRPCGFAIGERLEDDVVAALRLGRTVPRPVERNESATLIRGGEGLPGIDQKIVRRPVTGQRCDRSLFLGADADLPAVATIFRRQHELIRKSIIIAFRPTIVGAFFQLDDFLGRKLGAFLGGKEARPVLRKLIAAVLGDEKTPGGVERKSFTVAQAGRIAFRRRETLIRFVCVIEPRASRGFPTPCRADDPANWQCDFATDRNWSPNRGRRTCGHRRQ